MAHYKAQSLYAFEIVTEQMIYDDIMLYFRYCRQTAF